MIWYNVYNISRICLYMYLLSRVRLRHVVFKVETITSNFKICLPCECRQLLQIDRIHILHSPTNCNRIKFMSIYDVIKCFSHRKNVCSHFGFPWVYGFSVCFSNVLQFVCTVIISTLVLNCLSFRRNINVFFLTNNF